MQQQPVPRSVPDPTIDRKQLQVERSDSVDSILRILRIGRRKSFEERDAVSRAKASKLSSELERCNERETSLKKMGNVRQKASRFTHSPSFQTLTPKQAAAQFQKHQQLSHDMEGGTTNMDPAPTKPMENEQSAWWDQQSTTNKEMSHTRGERSAVYPSAGNQHNINHPQPKEERGRFRRGHPSEIGSHAAATFATETLSAHGHSTEDQLNMPSLLTNAGYKASNGRIYHSDNLC